MTKILAVCGALSVAAVLALAEPAGAAQQQRPDGYRNNDQIEVSSARRHRRVYRYRYHRYWGPGPYYYGPYYRPYYYRPAPFPLGPVWPFWW